MQDPSSTAEPDPSSRRAAVAVLVALALSVLIPAVVGKGGPIPDALLESAPAPTVRAPASPVVLGSELMTGRTRFTAPWAVPDHGQGPFAVVQPSSMRAPITPQSHRLDARQSLAGWSRFDYVPLDIELANAPAALASVDLAEQLPGARVEIVRDDGSVRPCERYIFGRWACGPDAWNYVGVTEIMVRERAADCIWAHPSAEGELRITLPDLPRATGLTGRFALADAGADAADGAGVRFAVDVDGQTVHERAQENRRGWTSWRAAVPQTEMPTMDVTFRVGADEVGARHFCFTAAISMVQFPAPRRTVDDVAEPPEGSAAGARAPAEREGSGTLSPGLRLRPAGVIPGRLSAPTPGGAP